MPGKGTAQSATLGTSSQTAACAGRKSSCPASDAFITIVCYIFDVVHSNSPQTNANKTIYLPGKQACLTKPETES